MAKENKKSSLVPALIILVVLAAAVGGFAWLYSTSKSPNANTSANSANGRTNAANNSRPGTTIAANAPPGAAIGINSIGSPAAKVTIEEFADFQCPSCAVAHPVMKDIQAAFAGNNNVRFVFRHFPLTIHDKSYDAAVAVEAAGMQGQPKFWAMMDQMMSNQQAWANNQNFRELWRGYAEKIGLDTAKWQDDMAGMAAKGRVDLDIQRARGVGVGSTPSIYINGRLIPFSDVNVPAMRQLIDAEIQNTASSGAPVGGANTVPSNTAPANVTPSNTAPANVPNKK